MEPCSGSPWRILSAGSALAVLTALSAVPAHGAPAVHGADVGATRPQKHGRVAKKSKPPPPPPLDGQSLDFAFDGRPEGHAERSYAGRIFVHRKAAAAGRPLPTLVFLHGTNSDKVKYRWMGGGQEGDVRRMISELIEAGHVPPMLVAAPSSIDPNTIANAMTSWPAFDLDAFLDRAERQLDGAATIDRSHVLVAAHSGGGCNPRGGLTSALRARRTPVFAGLSIDTCMLTDEARDLAHLRPSTHVIIAWQSISWQSRGFADFRAYFQREVKKAPPPAGILRELSFEQPTQPMPHDAMVGLTLKKWLPRLLGAPTAVQVRTQTMR